MESFILKNFKHPNHKLKILSSNIFFNKNVLLISAKLSFKTIYILKISGKHLHCL